MDPEWKELIEMEHVLDSTLIHLECIVGPDVAKHIMEYDHVVWPC